MVKLIPAFSRLLLPLRFQLERSNLNRQPACTDLVKPGRSVSGAVPRYASRE